MGEWQQHVQHGHSIWELIEAVDVLMNRPKQVTYHPVGDRLEAAGTKHWTTIMFNKQSPLVDKNLNDSIFQLLMKGWFA